MADVDCYVGEIRMYAGTLPPAGWMFCDGHSLPISRFENLFSVITYTYGGSEMNFKLPDLQGRIPVNAGIGQGLKRRSCGDAFGEEQVTLTEANITKHTHQICLSEAEAGTTNDPKGNYLADSVGFKMYKGFGVSATALHEKTLGTGHHQTDPHPNMMPSQCINFIIAYDGMLPAQADGQE